MRNGSQRQAHGAEPSFTGVPACRSTKENPLIWDPYAFAALLIAHLESCLGSGIPGQTKSLLALRKLPPVLGVSIAPAF
jgi:hypothetical protein